jgi:hypothetical protein
MIKPTAALLLGRELGEAALVFLDRPQPGKLAALRTGEHVRMLPEHRFGQHVGFSGRQQMAHRAQQWRFDDYRRCQQAEQFFDRSGAALGGSFSRRCACRRAAQQAVPVPFDDLEAALQAGRVQRGGNRAEDQRRAGGAAQPAAELCQPSSVSGVPSSRPRSLRISNGVAAGGTCQRCVALCSGRRTSGCRPGSLASTRRSSPSWPWRFSRARGRGG